MADNFLTKLPLAGQLGVSALIAAIIGGVFYWQSWGPMVEQERLKTAELTALQSDIRSLEVTANKLQEFQREVALREAKLETLKRILPADKETPELMKKVQYLAAQSNLSVKTFTPGATVNKEFPMEPSAVQKPGAPGASGQPAAAPPGAAGQKPGQTTPAEYYQEWPINVDLHGTYHNLGMFFDRVGRLSRLVNVGNLKIKNQTAPRPSNTIQVSCVATTFVYVEASPSPGPPSARP
jgi:type IV pilus assembly protein PilO